MTQKNKSNVPKLRFPEFEGAWNTTTLGKITKIFDGTHQTPNYVKHGVPFFSVEHVTANQFENTKLISHEVFERENEKVKLERNDILMTRIGDIGTARLIDWDVQASFYVSLALLKKDPTNFISGFLSSYIHTPYVARELYRRTIHVAFPKKINLGEISNCKLHLPTLTEQRKIAEFFSAVDTKIAQLAEKKRLLEDYKKGCMQQLFSQKIRFKDENGNEFPDWEEKRLGEVARIRTGEKDVNEGNPHGIYPFFTCAKQHTYSDSYSFNSDAILIAGNGEVGHCMKYSGKFEAYQRTYVLTDFATLFDYLFVYMSTKFTEHVVTQKQMGAMPYIKLSALKDFPISFPHPDEQRKIADFLSALDRKIERVTEEHRQAQTFKKGLLQQMFV